MAYKEGQQDFEDMKKYLYIAKEAVSYVKGVMDIGAPNKAEPWEWYGKITRGLCAGTAVSKGELAKRVGEELARMAAPTWKDQLDVEASWAKHFGCGNCGPQSAVAFVFLRNKGVRPLDWMHYNNLQHAFVIVGRKNESEPGDSRTWGKKAVVCDPWRGQAEPAMPYANIWFVNKTVELLHREE